MNFDRAIANLLGTRDLSNSVWERGRTTEDGPCSPGRPAPSMARAMTSKGSELVQVETIVISI